MIEQTSCKDWAELWEVDEWIGAPIEGLDVWSSRMLAEIAARFTDAPDDMGDSAVYLHRKWIGLSVLPLNVGGILLCRARVGLAFSYFIGQFVRGRLRKLSSIESSDDARRLRFHLDVQANCPLRIEAATSNGLVKLRLVRRLPKREAKVLLLGWQVSSPMDEHPGVTHHVFPEETLPIVRRAFEGLGIVWSSEVERGDGIYERDI
ncbi:hypothetical protein [Sodalis sp. RH20]|uniref:hypothetical protein n=1 Tax=unclassified Sodalis (in: enterobacteria) TaxID=2636512 RepID=UPI0039B6DF5B